MKILAHEVFVPGAYPVRTYIERTDRALEKTLSDALKTPGQVVSLSGPSKSGKTVLVEKVVGRDLLIGVSGASIKQAEEVWDHVLDWMDLPQSTLSTRQVGAKGGAELGGKAGVGVKFLAQAEGTMKGTVEVSTESVEGTTRQRRGLQQVVDEIANSEFVVLIDDFHYMDRQVQIDVAKSLKEAVRLGVKIVTITVTHRGDDVVRALPELRGRVKAIDLEYWDQSELRKIAEVGFAELNVTIGEDAIRKLVSESAGSPQLTQSLCLQGCFVLDIREKTESAIPKVMNIDDATAKKIFQQTSTSTDFRSLVDVLDAGPRTRGTERKSYKFKDGREGDVYTVVLQAIAADPPKLAFPYQELLDRTTLVCRDEAPVGSSVTGTCLHMTKLAREKFPDERAIDWDEQTQVLDIPDPYLLFYLRWSGRVREV